MAERKTMRDYIMGNQERTMPKRKTMGQYIIEAKIEALRRQFETFSPPCKICGLVGHDSQDCLIGNSWDDYEIVPNENQHDPHSSNWKIDYIPPCMKHLWPTHEKELDINERLTTLNQNTIAELSHSPPCVLSTQVEPKTKEESEVITLTTNIELNEEFGHEGHVFTKREETLHEESPDEVHKHDCVVLDMKKRSEVQNVLGTIMLAIGDVVVEVQKGKVNLRCGNEDDVLNALNSTENFSHFIYSYLGNAVITNYSSDLSMQDPLEKSSILHDPYKMVDVVELKISLLFEVHPPQGKTNNNVNHMIKKLRRGNALKVKFSLGEPPD
ncbi:hypothetical protein MTR_0032s0030 [Medicago truncatula]|uniref:Uncharacterized protein n=1 Tax=Medicago truncatula TaxID=3880 RepID=A0A072TIG3_MEDTR|nr:hypothetical protein MTR_0032s0030 [Medicago truncatula]